MGYGILILLDSWQLNDIAVTWYVYSWIIHLIWCFVFSIWFCDLFYFVLKGYKNILLKLWTAKNLNVAPPK